MKEYIRTSGFGIIWASTHIFPLCVPTPFKLPCSRIPVPFTVRRPESELRLQPDLKVKRSFDQFLARWDAVSWKYPIFGCPI